DNMTIDSTDADAISSKLELHDSQLTDLEPTLPPLQPNEMQDIFKDVVLDWQAQAEITEMLDMADIEDNTYVGQWNQFERLSSIRNKVVESMIYKYCQETPMLKFRIMFADVIESKCWQLIDTNDCQPGGINLRRASTIVSCLQDAVASRLNDSYMQIRVPIDGGRGGNLLSVKVKSELLMWEQELRSRYSQQPMELVQVMQKMLKREQYILEMAEKLPMCTNEQPHNGAGTAHPTGAGLQKHEPMHELGRVQYIIRDLNQLEIQSREITERLERMVGEYQQLHLCTGGNLQVLDSYDPLMIASNDERRTWKTITDLRDSLVQTRQLLIHEYHKDRLVEQLQSLLRRIKCELAEWKRAEAYLSNGKHIPDSSDIDQLEDCCKPLAKLILQSLEQILKLQHIEVDNIVKEQENMKLLDYLRQHYESLAKDLVENSLVVEKQPPQVLMKDKKFMCQLRHLVADGLSIHQFRFDTQVQLVNTEAVCAIVDGGPTTPIKPSGRIVNHSAKSDFVEQTKQLHVHMRNMSLSMRQRGDRGRADCVAEEKFCMVFRAFISLRFPSKAEYDVIAQTFSLPIVVISHGKQEADAQATIFWDNAFSESVRRPFEVPDSVPWNWILDGLNCLWKKECEKDPGGATSEGIGLTHEAKKYLTVKLLGTDSVDPLTHVSWRQFNRENLQGKGFTFWTWFFKIMELVSSPYVRKFWNLRYITGFIGKTECQNFLLTCPLGAFMFRFSDSQLGAISISCYTYCEKNQRNEVGHLEPDTIKKLQTRSLPDMVKDLDYLLYLGADIPKHQAFGPYYTPEYPRNNTCGKNDYWPKGIQVVTKNKDSSSFHDLKHSPVSSDMGAHVHFKSSMSPTGFGSPAGPISPLNMLSPHSSSNAE
uniref:STAT transcription factor protein interaction domain-containing protein n=1 Tax=Ciona savignyi TaxID=51511 RepID=H2Z5N2_CIOSA